MSGTKVLTFFVVTLTLGPLSQSAKGAEIAVKVKVSPHVISFSSAGTWATVHAEIPYRTVNRSYGVTLGNQSGTCVRATVLFADNRGELVAKFPLSKVKQIVAKPATMLILKGATVTGDLFSGKETVKVVR